MTYCPDFQREQRAQCRRSKARSLQRRWLEALTWGNKDLSPNKAKEIQLWLNIFPVNWRQLPDSLFLEQQIDTIHTNMHASYKYLLEGMVLDPAIQISLNGTSNHRQNPNENLARELLELFTLGEGQFTEKDIQESARALTGYRLNSNHKLLLIDRRHDNGVKQILKRSEKFNGSSLALWLGEQTATAHNITKRVWLRLVGTHPSAIRLDKLADDWRRNKLSIPWLVDEIQTSQEALLSRRNGLRIADPLEMISRSLHLLNSRHPDALSISLQGLRAMGQMPFEPPSVKGWPTNTQWLQTRWMRARRRTLQNLIADEEAWASANLPPELSSELTPIPPLNLRLPAAPSRENLLMLFSDPVWQLA